jgi:AsmA protein
MGRLVKILLVLVAGIVGVAVIAAVALFLFFDPNNFREEISAAVMEETGRELTIEGDLSLSVFPWIAVEIGKTSLGNADGFGNEPFLAFDQARLSVKLMPLLFRQEVKIGTASLDALQVNLQVADDGTTNWDDLAAAGEDAEAEDPSDDSSVDTTALDIADIRISNAKITYADAQAGVTYSITGLSMSSGRIAAGTPFDIDAEFNFDVTPGLLGGQLSISGTVLMSEVGGRISVDGLNVSGNLRGIAPEPTDFNFDSRAMSIDTAAQTVSLGEMDLAILGLSMTANVEPFSYAVSPRPRANLRVHEYSIKELMQTLGDEVPETIDPNALQRVSFVADLTVGDTALSMTNMTMQLDDTTMQGNLSVPTTPNGIMRFELVADSIILDGYMAPATDEVAVETEEAAIEIPVDMIRAMNASGSFKLERAILSGMTFENLEVFLNIADDKLRLHPISAELFDGAYKGDVRIDASTNTPSLSVNENIVDVQLTPLVEAMFGVANVTGTVNGTFALAGRGSDMDAIRQDLDGNISFELKDGAWEGTDVWYQLRRARATLRQEPAPEPKLPARTEFSQVSTSGDVVDGIMQSDDLVADLPFMRVTGSGIVNFVSRDVDYSLEARVVEKPELMTNMSDAEIADFTAAVVPLKISGPLSSPSFGIDIEGMMRREVERAVEKEKDRIKDKLLEAVFGSGSDEEDAGDADAEAVDGEEKKKKKKKNPLEDALKDLIGD